MANAYQLPPLDRHTVWRDAHLGGGPWGPRQIPSTSHLQFRMSAHPGVGLSVCIPVSVSLFILRTCSWFPSVSVCLVGLHVCSCSRISSREDRERKGCLLTTSSFSSFELFNLSERRPDITKLHAKVSLCCLGEFSLPGLPSSKDPMLESWRKML